jgi:hypothetical protein
VTKDSPQQKARELRQTQQSSGWKYLEEHLRNVQADAEIQYRKTDDKKYQNIANGIDALFVEISSIYAQDDIEKQS